MRITGCLAGIGILAAVALVQGGCSLSAMSVPAMDGSSTAGRQAVLDAINKSLTEGDCSTAIAWAETLYNSDYTGNDARMARAAAHACNQGLDSFFGFLGQVPSENWGMVAGQGSYFFRTASKLFYTSSASEQISRIDSGSAALEALQATLNPGTYVPVAHRITSNDYNTGSTQASDRTLDANIYMVLVNLATMGALQNYYASPNTTTWKKGKNLGSNGVTDWEIYSRIDSDACLYVASLLTMVDSYAEISAELTPSLTSSFNVFAALGTLLDAACAAGCNNINPTGLGSSSGCQDMGALCSACPALLRDPSSCTATANAALGKKNPYACAAAGIINFIDQSTAAGWVGP